jgi:hypothetical protein
MFGLQARSGLLALTAAVALCLVAPGLASAQSQSFSVGGGPFPAGGDPDYTTTINFDTSAGAPQSAIVSTTPGVLASLAANPSCVQSTQYTAACQISTNPSSATVGGVPVPVTAYLVPPNDKANDAAGIDILTSPPSPTGPTHAEVQLRQTSSGNVQSVLNIDVSGSGGAVTSTSLTVRGMLNGQPFNHMPSNCSPGPSSLTVNYANGTSETTPASPDFTITGCGSLPYAPKLTGTAIKDLNDSGTKVTTTVTQAADEAASSGNSLTVPYPTLAPNLAAVSLQNSGIAVGSATSVSPLLPTPLVGQIYLTGPTPFSPQLTIKFPPPSQLTLTGSVNLQTSTVTFTGVPDVPQTKLVVTLFGGPKALEQTTCQPPSGTLTGTFTGQNGKVVHDSLQLVVTGCPGPPTASGASLSGLASGKPVLRFRLNRGPNKAPKVKSFTVSLPGGLSFAKTKRGKGISVTGSHTIKLSRGKLTVTLRGGGANTVTVKLSGPALKESKHLLQLARKHKQGRLKVRVAVTDADGNTTTLTLRV